MTFNFLCSLLQLGSFLIFLLHPACSQGQSSSDSLVFAPDRIQITRDAWGVPHIFAPTDSEVAYGLAWATAEDDFVLLQEFLLQAKQLSGLYEGEAGVDKDFFVHFIQTERTVLHDWPKMQPAFQRYLAGYCAGLNAYAEKHKDQRLLKELFPLQPSDLLQAYVLRLALLAGVDKQLKHLQSGDVKKIGNAPRFRSTAYALHPSRTKNEETFLGIQAHFPLSGPLQLYEAHLYSEEGLNCTGALFFGDASIVMGSNKQLAWAQTLNDFDQIDIYELQMHPQKKLHYRYNGEYLSLEKRRFKTRLGAGLFGRKVRKTTYLSVYGPVLQSANGRFYALRSPSFLSALGAEEYYELNKASSWEAFKKGLRLQGLPFLSLLYVDREANMRFVANGLLPQRSAEYSWLGVVPGDTASSNWQVFHRLEELPQLEVDSCGYLLHAGQHPRSVACTSEALRNDLTILQSLPEANHRSQRLRALLQDKPQWSFEALRRLPFDAALQANSFYWKNWQGLRQLDPLYYPHLEANIRQLQDWSFAAKGSDTTTALALLTLDFLLESHAHPERFFSTTMDIEAQAWVNAVQAASAYLLKHHNSTWVELEDVVKWYNNIGVPTGTKAFPGVLSWGWGQRNANGHYQLEQANSYLFFVRFDRRGVVEINSLRPFKAQYKSRKYVSEADLYEEQDYKYRSLEKAYNLETAVQIYIPDLVEKQRQIPQGQR